MKNESKNVYDIVIYVLFFILICILFYSFFKLVYYKLSSEPKNCTNVSSSATEKSQISSELLHEVTYYDINTNSSINGISLANFIYEYLSTNSIPIYKGIFTELPNGISGNCYTFSKISKNDVPNLNTNEISKQSIGTNDDANFIFSKIFYNHTSNFVYNNGHYTHYLTKYPQLDSLTNNQIIVSNVVIQIANEEFPSNYSTGSGHGYLCTKGKLLRIKWKKDSGPIKLFDSDGNEISISEGKTWWIIGNPNDEFLFK